MLVNISRKQVGQKIEFWIIKSKFLMATDISEEKLKASIVKVITKTEFEQFKQIGFLRDDQDDAATPNSIRVNIIDDIFDSQVGSMILILDEDRLIRSALTPVWENNPEWVPGSDDTSRLTCHRLTRPKNVHIRAEHVVAHLELISCGESL